MLMLGVKSVVKVESFNKNVQYFICMDIKGKNCNNIQSSSATEVDYFGARYINNLCIEPKHFSPRDVARNYFHVVPTNCFMFLSMVSKVEDFYYLQER